MAIDFTGGFDVAREYFLTKPPTIPNMRDNMAMWVWDDRGEIGLPRFSVEPIAPDWENPTVHSTVAFPDGRALRVWGNGPAHPTVGPAGLPTQLGAGPLRLECLEPFRRHRATFKGEAVDTTFEALLKGEPDGPKVKLEYEVETETVAPPWAAGSLDEETGRLNASKEGLFTGGDRYEQLFRATGIVRLDGVERPFSGGGIRIRRQGVRNMAGFWGHCWQTAFFPSGRAFGYCAFPPKDGTEYNEGFVFTGDGGLIPARVVEAPWMTCMRHRGDDVSFVLESKLGRTRVEGETILGVPVPVMHIPQTMCLARYRWDGEEANGMCERSNVAEKFAA
jgi:hypothetical protein